MTAPCSHTPPCPLDKLPCEPCGHCNAPAGVWCAPRCPRKLERTGDPAGNAGPERWPAEWFRRPAAEAPAVVTFRMADGVELGSVRAVVGVDLAEPGGDRTVTQEWRPSYACDGEEAHLLLRVHREPGRCRECGKALRRMGPSGRFDDDGGAKR